MAGTRPSGRGTPDIVASSLSVNEDILIAAGMTNTLKLMAILAHPDDESLGTGGALAKYASEGVETYVVTAIRGERGRYHDGTENPGPEAMVRIREQELLAAADALGVKEIIFLDYMDGDLDRADPNEAIGRIVQHLRRVRPQVVLTFDQAGAYGHADHIAICQFATAATVAAADAEYLPEHGTPHAVSKLYYFCWAEPQWAAYQAAFKKLTMTVDGVERQATPWPDWAITTRIDTRKWWPQVWEAISCHATQVSGYQGLKDLPPDLHEGLWGFQTFYRVFSTVNGGSEREEDLFEGLRT
jgi:LmbE family N-acetylglucosaminyl deacetylase